MKKFIEYAESQALTKTLVNATIKAFGGTEEFKRVYEDVVNHGIDGGFGKFIYYSDTVPFGKKHFNDYKLYLKILADDLGEKSIYGLLATFKCMNGMIADEIVDAIYCKKGAAENDDQTVVFNCIAWAIGEQVCRCYYDYKEKSDG